MVSSTCDQPFLYRSQMQTICLYSRKHWRLIVCVATLASLATCVGMLYAADVQVNGVVRVAATPQSLVISVATTAIAMAGYLTRFTINRVAKRFDQLEATCEELRKDVKSLCTDFSALSAILGFRKS